MIKTGTNLFRLAGGLLFVLLLAGCQTTKYAGKGPVVLSPGVLEAFEEYKNKPHPAFFLISEDGTCGYSLYCPASVASGCVSRALNSIDLSFCKRDCEASCLVLAVQRKIVWNGTVMDWHYNHLSP